MNIFTKTFEESIQPPRDTFNLDVTSSKDSESTFYSNPGDELGTSNECMETNLADDPCPLTSTPLGSTPLPPLLSQSPVRCPTPPPTPHGPASLVNQSSCAITRSIYDFELHSSYSDRFEDNPPDRDYNLLTIEEKLQYNAFWHAYYLGKGLSVPIGKILRPRWQRLERDPSTGDFHILRIIKIYWNMGTKYASCIVEQPGGCVLMNIATIFLVKAGKYSKLFESYFKQQYKDLTSRRMYYRSDPRLFVGTIFEEEMKQFCRTKNVQFDEDGNPPERVYRKCELRLKNPL